MSTLTKLARGEDCYIRLPICLWTTETVVFCHFSLAGESGMAFKVPDVLGCPGCFNCHDAVDRRRYMDMDPDFVRLAHAEGMARWIAKLVKLGRVK